MVITERKSAYLKYGLEKKHGIFIFTCKIICISSVLDHTENNISLALILQWE